MVFDPKEAERLAERLDGSDPDSTLPDKGAVMLRAAIERVRELDDKYEELLTQTNQLLKEFNAAEKVVEAARVIQHKPYSDKLLRAIQEYDRG